MVKILSYGVLSLCKLTSIVLILNSQAHDISTTLILSSLADSDIYIDALILDISNLLMGEVIMRSSHDILGQVKVIMYLSRPEWIYISVSTR